MFSQALGDHCILYAEQTAIAKLPFLLEKVGITFDKQTRIILATDNEITFLGTHVYNGNGAFPELLTQIRKICNRKNTLLMKVKGHITPPIYGNAVEIN